MWISPKSGSWTQWLLSFLAEPVNRGNASCDGVVPDVAALAFVTLYKELIEYESLNRKLSRDGRD